MGIEPTMPLLAQSIIGFEVICGRISAHMRTDALVVILVGDRPFHG